MADVQSQRPIERIKKYVSFKDFLQIIERVVQKNGLELIVEEQPPEIKRDEDGNTYTLVKKEFSITEGNEKKYRLRHSYEYEHRYGDGGFCDYITELSHVNRRDKIAIISKSEVSWFTYSDDSEDHGGHDRTETNLYLDSPFTREIFKELREIEPDDSHHLSSTRVATN